MDALRDALKRAGLAKDEPATHFDGVPLEGAVVLRSGHTRHVFEFSMAPCRETDAFARRWLEHWPWAYSPGVDKGSRKVRFWRSTSSD